MQKFIFQNLLLLLSTGTDSNSYRDQIQQKSLRMALDLFDGVKMLEVIIEENEVSHGVPKPFEKAILTFVCISFILSPLQLVEIKLRNSDSWGIRHRCREGLRTALQIICVNSVFGASHVSMAALRKRCLYFYQ